LNLLAEKCGIDPWEFRYKNVVRPGDTLPNGQIVDESCGIAECLDAVKEAYPNNKKKRKETPFRSLSGDQPLLC
jgi:aldehyde oxidoreductase